MTRPTALVTGASSGIGAAFAERLAGAGYDLVLVARREERLVELGERLRAQSGVSTEVMVADLGQRAGLDLVAERAAAGDVDVLVSNAGVSAYGAFAEIDPVALDEAWMLNSTATPVLARAALPGMLKRGSGGVIAVSSNLAFSAGIPSASSRPAEAGQAPAGQAPAGQAPAGQTPAGQTPTGQAPTRPAPTRGFPQRALYVGAKAGMLAFMRVLASELADTGVQATVVCPGLVSSEWNGGASRGPAAMTPERVVQAAWASFGRGEVVCLPGLEDAQLFDQLGELERRILGGNIGSDLAERYRD